MLMIKHMSGAHLYLVLWRTFRAVEKLDQQSIAAQGFGCTSDFAVLEVLYHKGPLPVKEIGAKVLLTSGSITTAIQRLEERGWLIKRPHPEDARSVIVHLTEDGQRLIEAAFERHALELDQIFDGFGDEEKSEFFRLVRKLGMQAEAQL